MKNPVLEEIRIRIRREADMDRWNQIQEEIGITNKSEVGRFMIRKYPLGKSDHHELLIFLIQTFIKEGTNAKGMPEYLQEEVKGIIQKEGLI
jgi:hypothetical protein